MKTILALDLGTKLGYCHGHESTDLQIGTEVLATAREITEWGKSRATRRCDPRALRLCEFLHRLPRPDIVIFEDVEFASYTKQVQLWASFRAVVWLVYGRDATVLIECVPVSTLKKFATGAGNADKAGMLVAAKRFGLNTEKLDDNAIDALHLWRWGERNLSRWQGNKNLTTK